MKYISELPKILRYHGVRKTAKAKQIGIAHQTFSQKILEPNRFTVQEIIDLCQSTPEINLKPQEMFEFIVDEINALKKLEKKSEKFFQKWS
jgi:CRISPR/Cas system endoribonuclease Cas6 (RAMP superfamily)